jgi:hypothetical protein
MTKADTLTAGLRTWIRGHDPNVRAAVELLLWHGDGFWLRRRDFTGCCVSHNRTEAWISWRSAREFVDKGSVASTSEMAILDLAVALGEDRFRLNIMGPAHSRAIADAVAKAAGLQARR